MNEIVKEEKLMDTLGKYKLVKKGSTENEAK